MSTVYDNYFPPVESLIELEPEQLAEPMLLYLNMLRNNEGPKVAFPNAFNEGTPEFARYAADLRTMARLRLAETWDYLYSQGFLSHHPDDTSSMWYRVTQRGQRVYRPGDFEQFKHIRLLPKDVLHQKLVEKVWPLYVVGDFETAIFQAFKQIEIKLRAAGNYPDNVLAVQLARRAFDPQSGPLTDASLPPGEQHADSDLFAGALGKFRNPTAHRDVNYDDPAEAASILLFANTLMKLIDSRTK